MIKRYSTKELRIIANALNVLMRDSDKAKGMSMNLHHILRFHNNTHYIDHHDKLGCKVYKKLYDYKNPEEIF